MTREDKRARHWTSQAARSRRAYISTSGSAQAHRRDAAGSRGDPRSWRPARKAVLIAETQGDEEGRLEALARFATDNGVPQVERVSRKQSRSARRVSAVHQGVSAWAPELSMTAPEDVLVAEGLLSVVLDGIQDPQNFGAVIQKRGWARSHQRCLG